MNQTTDLATLIADIEHVLAEWRDTQADVPVAAAVVRGMSQEIRGVLYERFAEVSR